MGLGKFSLNGYYTRTEHQAMTKIYLTLISMQHSLAVATSYN
jgi:hypothetical protein